MSELLITVYPSRGGYTQEQINNVKIITEYFKKKEWEFGAIAGILGNMEQESYILPDISEISGGRGYGLVQWTNGADKNMKGVQYIQVLLKQASILGDYRSIHTQLELLNWHMYNGGQYLPKFPSYPQTAQQFIKLTNPELAARVFEMNFERPRDPHPERALMARGWYDYLVVNSKIADPKFKVSDKVRLEPFAKNMGSYSSNRPIDPSYLDKEFTVAGVVRAPQSNSTYQVSVNCPASNIGNIWILEQDLYPSAKFKVSDKVRLEPFAKNMGSYSSNRPIDSSYLDKEFTVAGVARAPQSNSTYQVSVNCPASNIGNIWILEQDLKSL